VELASGLSVVVADVVGETAVRNWACSAAPHFVLGARSASVAAAPDSRKARQLTAARALGEASAGCSHGW